MRWMRIAAVVALGAWGCDACEGEPVPYQPPADENESASSAEAAKDAGSAVFETREGRSLAEGAKTLETATGELHLGEEEQAHAVLELSDDAGLLLWLTDANGSLVLAHAAGESVLRPRPLQRLAMPGQRCEAAKARLHLVAPGAVVARALPDCRSVDDAGVEEDEAPPVELLWLVELPRGPRVAERLAVLPGPPSSASIGLDTHTTHAQGTETQVSVAITVSSQQGPPLKMTLPWKRGAGGATLAQEAVEEALAEHAAAAERALGAGAPVKAAERARAVIDAYYAVCRDAHAARLRVGDSIGARCGRSQAVGKALAVEGLAQLEQGRVLGATYALQAMHRAFVHATPEQRERLHAALQQRPATAPTETRIGPRRHPATGPRARLSTLGFLKENILLIRGSSALRYLIEAGDPTAADPSKGSTLITAPEGHLAVTGIERGCEGYVLQIVPANRVIAGISAGRAVARPLLKAVPAPSGTACPGLPKQLRDDDGGFRLLGWTADGVVAARGEELRVVPLDAQGRSLDEPVVWPPGKPLAAPAQPGLLAPDGSAYVLPTPAGIAVRSLIPAPRTSLLRPEGWNASDADNFDLSISASGERVAALRDGRVEIYTRTP